MLSILWRHNGHDGVSNLQPNECLLNRSYRHRSKKRQSSALLETGEFPAQMASKAENASIGWLHHACSPPALFLVAIWLFIVYLKAGYHHVIDVRISDVLIKRHIYGRDTPAKNVPNPLDIDRSDISSYFLQQTKCLVKIWVRLQAHK